MEGPSLVSREGFDSWENNIQRLLDRSSVTLGVLSLDNSEGTAERNE